MASASGAWPTWTASGGRTGRLVLLCLRTGPQALARRLAADLDDPRASYSATASSGASRWTRSWRSGWRCACAGGRRTTRLGSRNAGWWRTCALHSGERGVNANHAGERAAMDDNQRTCLDRGYGRQPDRDGSGAAGPAGWWTWRWNQRRRTGCARCCTGYTAGCTASMRCKRRRRSKHPCPLRAHPLGWRGGLRWAHGTASSRAIRATTSDEYE